MKKQNNKDLLRLILIDLAVFGISLIGTAKQAENRQLEINQCLVRGGIKGSYHTVGGIFTNNPTDIEVEYCLIPTPSSLSPMQK